MLKQPQKLPIESVLTILKQLLKSPKLIPEQQLRQAKQSIPEQQLPQDRQVPHRVPQFGILQIEQTGGHEPIK